MIQGSDLNEVYDRVCEAAANDAANGTLIVHLDLPVGTSEDLPLPQTIPCRSQWRTPSVGVG